MRNDNGGRMPDRPVRTAPTTFRGLRTISWLFDELIRIPGTKVRFGLDALLGLLPGGGDLVGGAVSAYALAVAARLGAPTPVILRMGLNIIVDAVVGAVPFLGDLFDVGWKANRRNLTLLEEYTAAPVAAKRSSTVVVGLTIGAVLASLFGIAVAAVWLIGKLF